MTCINAIHIISYHVHINNHDIESYGSNLHLYVKLHITNHTALYDLEKVYSFICMLRYENLKLLKSYMGLRYLSSRLLVYIFSNKTMPFCFILFSPCKYTVVPQQ
jgi:hypothetical protein